MLTSSNQYLRPEFLSPLPTTVNSTPFDDYYVTFNNFYISTQSRLFCLVQLDAKKSPLALLAQTCSNIGADNPNIKPIIPPLEKPKDQEKNKNRSSLSSSTSSSSQLDDKPSFKPYESAKKEDSSNGDIGGGKRSPSSKSGSPAASRIASSSPAASSVGSSGKASPTASENGNSKSDASSSSVTATTTSSSTPSSHNTLSGLGYGGAAAMGLDLARDVSKETLSHLTSLSAAYKGLNPLANCCSPLMGHLPVDGVGAAHSFSQSIANQASAALKLGSYPVGSPLSPYVGYARIKTASGGTTLVPVCRDPFCTNCQMSMQSAQLGVCPSGCTQCSHDRLGAPPGLGLNPGLIPGLGSVPVSLASQLYPGAHSMLARPNVCSWMVGDTYCGKRFSTSEELLQHLRTHTNLSVTDSSSLPLLSPSLTVPSPSLSAAACHLHYSTAPSLTTQAGLRRTYPTSLSPVSSLSARYHPYKAPIPGFPGTPFAPLPHPSLGMYYSPYSLYGQRLGPPVHP
ncbi:unnamed protein product [Ixodes persulcatus]